MTSGLAVAFVGVSVVGYFAIGDPSKAATAAQQTTTVQRGTVSSAVTASGNAAALTSLAVNFQGSSSGLLTEVDVKVGDKVTKGETLAKVDDTSAKQTLATAQASLASAQASYETTVAGESTAKARVDSVAVQSAQTSLANAKTSARARHRDPEPGCNSAGGVGGCRASCA